MGYVRENKKLVISELDKDTIIKIFKLYTESYSYQKISNELNMTHELGKNWRDTTVKHVLDNVIYRGDYLDGKTTGNPVLYENVVPPIVSKELWQECQNQKGKNSRNYTRNVLYLFLQKVRCPKCGRIMAGKAPGGIKKHKYVYYKCVDCKGYIREDILEQKLAPLIMQLTEFDSLIKNQFGSVLTNKLDNPIPKLEKEVKAIEIKKDRLKQAYLNQVISLDEFKSENEILENNINALNKKIGSEKLNEKLDFSYESIMICRDIRRFEWIKANGAIGLSPLHEYENLSLKEKQSMFMRYIDSIEYEGSGKDLKITKINFRETFLNEYNNCVQKGMFDELANIQLENGRHLIYCSSPKSHKEVISYVDKLKELYDVDYIEFDVINTEKGELFDIKNKDVKKGYRAIKMIPIISDKREENISKKKLGLLTIPEKLE